MKIALIAFITVFGMQTAMAQDVDDTVVDTIIQSPDMTQAGSVFSNPQIAQRYSVHPGVTVFLPLDSAVSNARGVIVGPIWAQESPDISLKGHTVDGIWTQGDMQRAAFQNNGHLLLDTHSGSSLIATPTSDGSIILVDNDGNTARVVSPNRYSSNGVVHGLNATLLP